MARDLVSLRQQRAKAWKTASDIDTLAEGGQAAFDAAMAEVNGIDREIANAEKLAKARGDDALGTEADPANAAPKSDKGFMAAYRNLPAHMHQIKPGQCLSPAQGAAFGDFLHSVRRASVQGGRVDPRLIEFHGPDAAAPGQGANEQIGPDGGFLVEKDIADGLLMRTFALTRIASRARRVNISAKSNGLKINALRDDSRATGSRWGGVQTYWIGEGDSLTPSRPKFRQLNLQLKKLSALMYATDELLADTTALASVMQQAFPEELAFATDDAMFEGSGAAQPLGFMNSASKITVAKEGGQAGKTVTFQNIIDMWSRIRAPFITNAEWWVNQDVFPSMMGMSAVVGTGGIPVYLPPGGLSQSPYGTLMGRPVMPIEYANTLGTEGDICLVDPTQYIMIDKGDVQYATSIHVAFLTDEQAFRFIYRVDGQPIDDKPITPFKGTNKQGAFITLGTRA